MKIKKSEAWPIAGKAFPDYSGRKFTLEYADHFTASNLNWGGGTRNSYVAVNLDTEDINDIGLFPAPWAHASEGKTYDIPPRWAVVVHSIFQGVDCGLRIIMNRNDYEQKVIKCLANEAVLEVA